MKGLRVTISNSFRTERRTVSPYASFAGWIYEGLAHALLTNLIYRRPLEYIQV
jgi:hypothetical protein